MKYAVLIGSSNTTEIFLWQQQSALISANHKALCKNETKTNPRAPNITRLVQHRVELIVFLL